MKYYLRWTLKLLAGILVLAVALAAVFMFRVTYGFPIYEKSPIEIGALGGSPKVLVYSKTNGFIHKTAIEAGEKAIETMGKMHDWSVVLTKNAGVFNPAQLKLFDVVIWNNVTGRTLTDAQRQAFKDYIHEGGGFIGLHGAGDFSHRWPWYEDTLIGASFSHHTMNPQIQEGTIHRSCDIHFPGCDQLADRIVTEDEWYVFYNNPMDNSSRSLYTLDPQSIDPNGNFLFLARNKDWGMDVHPIIWYHCVGKGKSFYSAMGHSDTNYNKKEYLDILKSAILWASDSDENCLIEPDEIY